MWKPIGVIALLLSLVTTGLYGAKHCVNHRIVNASAHGVRFDQPYWTPCPTCAQACCAVTGTQYYCGACAKYVGYNGPTDPPMKPYCLRDISKGYDQWDTWDEYDAAHPK